MDFVERLDYLLNLKNKNRQTLCAKIEISRTSISNWSNLRTAPSVHTILKIASFLEVSVEYLLTGEEKKIGDIPEDVLTMAYEIMTLDKIDRDEMQVILNFKKKKYL